MCTHTTERVLYLEDSLRRSEETIQGLQQELAITKLAQTPTTDTSNYQLGAGQGVESAGRQRSAEPEVVSEVSTAAKSMQSSFFLLVFFPSPSTHLSTFFFKNLIF